jgi:hypothetical protein
MMTTCSAVGGYKRFGELKMEEDSSPQNVGNYLLACAFPQQRIMLPL